MNQNCEYCIKRNSVTYILIKANGYYYRCYICDYCYNDFKNQINYCNHCTCIYVDDVHYHKINKCYLDIGFITRNYTTFINYFNNQ